MAMSVVTAIIGTQPAASRENPDGLRGARLKTDFIFAVLPPVENAGYGRRSLYGGPEISGLVH
jgi:hypothetical protein